MSQGSHGGPSSRAPKASTGRTERKVGRSRPRALDIGKERDPETWEPPVSPIPEVAPAPEPLEVPTTAPVPS